MQEEDDSCVLALTITEILIIKARDTFYDNLFRAGIVGQIVGIAAENKAKSAVVSHVTTKAGSVNLNGIILHKFGEWCLMKTAESVYLWTEYMITELPSSSSGWFQTCINEKLSFVCNGEKEDTVSAYEETGKCRVFRVQLTNLDKLH